MPLDPAPTTLLPIPPLPAFLGPLGFQEIFVLLVVGLLLFGRRLPEVGRQVGKTIWELRRGMQQFKDELDRDGDFRDARSAIEDARRGFRETRDDLGRLPRPRAVFDDLTDSARSAGPVDPPGGSGPSTNNGSSAGEPGAGSGPESRSSDAS